MYKLIDFTTKKVVTPDSLVFTGKDGPWEVSMDIAAIKAKLNIDYFKISPPGLAKYLPFMPIKYPAEFVSLREMATPLIKSKSLGRQLGIGLDLYFKMEAKNPTGSFKDRGSAVDITVARELGAKSIILASTGSMAASCACYAAAAKMPCFVLVPEGVPSAKLAQVIAFGGHIVQIKGTYNDAADMAETLAKKMGFYLAGDYAYRVEGQKSAAFELIDQLLFQSPDVVLVPIGCGTNLAAYAKGFREYQQFGLIDKIPQLIGVQATGSDAVVRSFLQGKKNVEALEKVDTIASAIAVPNPIDGVKALDAIYSTQGSAYAVTDQEILEAQYLLSTEEGLFVESASAATVAALLKANAQGNLNNKKVVCVLTGDGLKDPSVILKAAIKPPTIYPDIKEFVTLYDSNFFQGKNMIFVEKSSVIFSTEPSLEQIKDQLMTLFNSTYSDKYLRKIKVILARILQKGKSITIADFQDSIQDALESLQHPVKKTFIVKDFEVTTSKDRASNATVDILIADEHRKASATGVGPVDALIKALSEACKESIAFKLTEYKVEIRHQGVDAVVYVELKLMKGNLKSVGCATSPDIIQASIEAFQEAYNGFPTNDK